MFWRNTFITSAILMGIVATLPIGEWLGFISPEAEETIAVVRSVAERRLRVDLGLRPIAFKRIDGSCYLPDDSKLCPQLKLIKARSIKGGLLTFTFEWPKRLQSCNAERRALGNAEEFSSNWERFHAGAKSEYTALLASHSGAWVQEMQQKLQFFERDEGRYRPGTELYERFRLHLNKVRVVDVRCDGSSTLIEFRIPYGNKEPPT
jgi:hypothetical protein